MYVGSKFTAKSRPMWFSVGEIQIHVVYFRIWYFRFIIWFSESWHHKMDLIVAQVYVGRERCIFDLALYTTRNFLLQRSMQSAKLSGVQRRARNFPWQRSMQTWIFKKKIVFSHNTQHSDRQKLFVVLHLSPSTKYFLFVFFSMRKLHWRLGVWKHYWFS